MKRFLLALLLLLAPLQADAYSGSGGVWAMKSGDFVARNFSGTGLGIQAAIDYVAQTGGYVQVHPGTYDVSSTIHVYGDNVWLVGTGQGAVTFNCTSGDTALAVMPSVGIKTNGWKVEGINFQVGAAYTGPLVYFNGGDFYWSVRDIKVVNPSSGFASDIGVQFMNCQNGVIENLWVRSDDTSNLFEIGVDADINDANQRGNLSFHGLVVSNAKVGTWLARSRPSNSVNNCTFTNSKWANSASLSKDNKTAIILNNQADQTAFINPHVEGFQTGLKDSLADDVQVIGGIFQRIENEAANAGTAISINTAEGVTITTPRIHDVFDGVVLSGATAETFFIEGRKSSVGGTYYADGSTGGRDKNVAVVKESTGAHFGYTGVMPESLRVIGESRMLAGAEVGFPSAGAESKVLSVDGGSTGTQEMRLQRNNQTDLRLMVQGASATKFEFRTDLTIGSPAGTNFGKWLTTSGKFRLGDATTPTQQLELAGAGMMTFGSTTQGSLGTPANGTVVYCSDCTKATPCAGGGTGAIAKRINGAWDCN